MRSTYRPGSANIPRLLTTPESGSWPLGGECGEPRLPAPEASRSFHANPVDGLLAPLIERAGREHTHLRFSLVGEFRHGDCRYRLPRFIFQGPPGGGSLIRLGLFAAIHGDEPAGAVALRDFLLALDDEPAPAQGYELYAYPVCNPSGLEDGTRHSRAGRDLNREFWHGSTQPEIYFLERELGVHQFAGLVALHSDHTSAGAYAFVRGATLTEALAKPVLAAASRFLPLADAEMIDGFPARAGSISECRDGVLSNPAELS